MAKIEFKKPGPWGPAAVIEILDIDHIFIQSKLAAIRDREGDSSIWAYDPETTKVYL